MTPDSCFTRLTLGFSSIGNYETDSAAMQGPLRSECQPPKTTVAISLERTLYHMTPGGGGLYKRVFLQKYFLDSVNLNEKYQEPVQWCGAPFAVLRRTSGSLGIEAIPAVVENQPHGLKNLYFRRDIHSTIPRPMLSARAHSPVLPPPVTLMIPALTGFLG